VKPGPWLRRRADLLLGAAGALALFLAFGLLPELHAFDMALASWLQGGSKTPLSPAIVLVDVPKGKDIVEFRQRLGQLLCELAADPDNRPRCVALDLWFDADIPGIEPVARGVAALQGAGCPVHGVLNVQEENGQLAQDDTRRVHLGLYERMDSVGHNLIARGPSGPYYQASLPSGRVAMALNLAGSGPVPEGRRLIHMGPPLELAPSDQVLGFDPQVPGHFRRFGAGPAAPPVWTGRIVLVGRLSDDRSPYRDRSGPEVVAWAINDQVSPQAVGKVLDSPALHGGLALAMPAFGLLVFLGLLRFLHAWRLKPWRIAALAGLVALLLPIGTILVLRAADLHYSQVLLPAALTALVLGLAARRRSALAGASERQRQDRLIPEHLAYDIFLSYRRTHAPWVEAELLPLLKPLRHPDGTPLRVFWDNQDLHSGNYNRQLEWAIHESRIFMPLLTPDYFDPDKPYCYWEMTTAYDRVPTGAMRMILLFHDGYDPALHGHRAFPALAAQHGHITSAPAFASKLLADLLAVDAQG